MGSPVVTAYVTHDQAMMAVEWTQQDVVRTTYEDRNVANTALFL